MPRDFPRLRNARHPSWFFCIRGSESQGSNAEIAERHGVGDLARVKNHGGRRSVARVAGREIEFGAGREGDFPEAGALSLECAARGQLHTGMGGQVGDLQAQG